MDSHVLHQIANTIRVLSIEAVEKANSGHPGMPMGCAEIGAFLYGHFLKGNPKHPKWLGRDRLILSAGHGSMWLYSCLHLAGYNVSLAEIERFRQLGSLTPGHPEYGHTEGVEATTGPLGQGVGNGVGLALGLKLLGARFDPALFDGKVVVVAGDGCIMEGVSSEVSSFAGHLGLNNLILIYDSNKICLDGPLSECCSEDTKARYLAYGWDVYELQGKDLSQMEILFSRLRAQQKKPTLIILHTVIGEGSPHKAGTHKVHGSPLGADEVAATKAALQVPQDPFSVPEEVALFFQKKRIEDQASEEKWNRAYAEFARQHPEKAAELQAMREDRLPSDLAESLEDLPIKAPISGRAASQNILQLLGKKLPQLYGGSADLSCSDLTLIKDLPIVTPGQFAGRNIKYGVREFGMGTIANGLAIVGAIRPFCGTFFTFSDYMRNSIRLAALSHYPVIYQFTHDSIFLGEDGPTHQPIEQLASLRAMPNLLLFRPADAREVKGAWLSALAHKGPSAIVLSRQNLPEIPHSHQTQVAKGAYLVKQETRPADFTLIATGSEVWLALEVASSLELLGKSVRVVSMPSTQLFDQQPQAYRDSILKKGGRRVSIEAASSFGWAKYVGEEGISIAIDTFGQSAPASDLAHAFGFTVDAIVKRLS
jgi:transketolase